MPEQIHEHYEDSFLYCIRHSAAHIMAEAVLEKFPDAKIAIGPAIEDGFYYDFDLPRPLTPEDLQEIEKRMRQIIAGNYPFIKRVISADEARQVFADQPYKLELIEGLEHGGLDEHGNVLTENRRFRFTPTTSSPTCAAAHTSNAPGRSTRLPSS